MNPTLTSTADSATSNASPGLIDRIARRLVVGKLGSLRHGSLILEEDGERTRLGDGAGGLEAHVHVRDGRFHRTLALGGSLGAARAYMNGWWTSTDLTAVIRLFARNTGGVSDGMERRTARLTGLVARAGQAMRRNTRTGSRKNISAHYDLSNDLFALFLDPTMTYSCGIFETPGATMEEASIAKLDRICRKLDLRASDHLMEIGTGWGSLAIHAARNYGCRVTTTTISREQYTLARQRIEEAGLGGRVEVLLKDYRDLEGQYDKLVSIEMIEAVGHDFHDAYFAACSRLLKPDGMMLLQAITIADQRYDHLRSSTDFIQKYVFPGSLLPSVAVITSCIARVTDFRLFHHEDITPHYATTLQKWRESFFDSLDEVRALGYPEEFIRMWDYYLCYCEGGFAERYIGDVQMLLSKPACRRPSIVPELAQKRIPHDETRACDLVEAVAS